MGMFVGFPTPRDKSLSAGGQAAAPFLKFCKAAGFSARGGPAFGGNPRDGCKLY